MFRQALVLATLVAALASAMPVHAAATADAQQKVGAKVGRPLGAAIEALNKTKNYQECVAKAQEADAVPEKTPYEQSQINEVLAICYLQLKDYANAAANFEKGYLSGQLPAEKVNDRLNILARLYYQLRDLPKAESYGSQWLKATGSADVTMLTLVGQSYYLDKKCDEAITYLGDAVKASIAGSEKPDENSLLIIQQCSAQKKDVAGVDRALRQLVTYYPKKDYWKNVLTNMLRQSGGNDRINLFIYRLMFQTDTMESADAYTEMATLCIGQGSPGEAVTVMEKGYSSKALETGGDKARNKDLLANARKQAAEDQKALPQIDKESRAAKQGEADVRLGQAYLSYGQADKAVEAIQRGIGKGGVKNMDDAYLLLGEAYLALGKRAEAADAFGKVQGADAKPVAELWAVYAGQQA